MMDDTHIRKKAKEALLAHLRKLDCVVTAERQETAGEYIVIKSPSGGLHEVLIRFLDLDKARSVKIPQSAFGYQLRDGQWILLVLYMRNMEPFQYLIPMGVFRTPNNVFVCNDQKPAFRYLSNWEIKVFTNAVPELSRYALDTAVIL